MRIRSWLFMGIGYLAGTRAGREKFDELKSSLEGLAQSDVVAGALERARGTFRGEDTEIRLPEDDEALDLQVEESEEEPAGRA